MDALIFANVTTIQKKHYLFTNGKSKFKCRLCVMVNEHKVFLNLVTTVIKPVFIYGRAKCSMMLISWKDMLLIHQTINKENPQISTKKNKK